MIADRFPAGRPAWEAAGATLVTDVAPFEAMKLRLLNASHSALAYLGYLAGAETVADAMRDPGLASFAARVMDDAIATLTVPSGTDMAAYKRSLLERFRNPALRHRTWQIAMDGSQKLPQRLLGTVRDNLHAGRRIDMLALAVAGWMRYASGRDEGGREIVVSDPLAGEFGRIAAAHRGDPPALARAFLGLRAIFGDDLPADPRFSGSVASWLSALFADGAACTVARAAAA